MAVYIMVTNVSEQLSSVLIIYASCSIGSQTLPFRREKIKLFKPPKSTPKITVPGKKEETAKGNSNHYKVVSGELRKRYPRPFWKPPGWLSITTLPKVLATCPLLQLTSPIGRRKKNYA